MSSTTTRLCVRMKYIEGALIRLLGLAGRRGFEIAKVDARVVDGGRFYEITLELSGARCPLTLQRQIAKLYDVERVEIVPALYDTPPLRLVMPGSSAPVPRAAAAPLVV